MDIAGQSGVGVPRGSHSPPRLPFHTPSPPSPPHRPSISAAEVVAHGTRLGRALDARLEGLVAGNIGAEAAAALAEEVRGVLGVGDGEEPEPGPGPADPRRSCAVLPVAAGPGAELRVTATVQNPKEANQAVVAYWQLGPGTVELWSLARLLEQVGPWLLGHALTSCHIRPPPPPHENKARPLLSAG